MHHETTVSGETLALLPQRAVYWASRGALLVADAHFGKDAAFRAQGVPVPEGSTAETLARLTELIALWLPRRIVFLGDFAHAKEASSDPTRSALTAWRTRHAALELTLVRGNHDRHDGGLAEALAMEVVAEPWCMGPFALCHHPQECAGHYVLAGHVHPAFRLSGRANQRARLPCFWFGPRTGVLPAFGAFTGSAPIDAAPGARIFVAGPERVHPIPGCTTVP